MPATTKEGLLRQATDCRRRLSMLLDLKRDVVQSIENTCNRVNDQLSEAETMALTADNARIDLMIQKVNNTIAVLEKFEEHLENARTVHDENDQTLAVQVAGVAQRSSRPLENPTGETTSNQAAVTGIGSIAARWLGIPETARLVEFNRPACEQSDQNDHLVEQQANMESEIVAESGENGNAYGLAQDATAEETIGEVFIDAASSDIAENGSFYSAASSVGTAAASRRPTEGDDVEDQETTIVAPSVDEQDYRSHVVSQGTGNPGDACQSNVAFAAGPELLNCKVAHVESPSLFWIYPPNHSVALLQNDLNMRLENANALESPQVGDYCAAPTEKDEDDMYRAKILDIKNNKAGIRFAKVLYIDTGLVDWVTTKALLELPSRFHHFHRQACPCALAEVEPTAGFWHDETIAAFRELCQSIDGETVQLSVTRLDTDPSPNINTVSVTRVYPKTSKRETVVISLIRSGNGKVKRAEFMTPMKGFERQNGELIGGADPPDDVDGWRFIVRATEEVTVDPEPAAKATEKSTAAASNAASSSARPVHRRAQNTAPASALAAASVESAASKLASYEYTGSVPPLTFDHLQNRQTSSTFYFRITQIESPSDFYIQLQDPDGRNRQLEGLTLALDEFYSVQMNQRIQSVVGKPTYSVYKKPIRGNPGYRLCRVFLTDWVAKPNPMGLCLDVRVNSTANALFVDYGNSMRVEAKDTWPLERRFCPMHAQAVRCKLFDIKPRSQTGLWDDDAVAIFKELLRGNPLIKGQLMSDREPFEIVAHRQDGFGGETCLNAKMVESKRATSTTVWA